MMVVYCIKTIKLNNGRLRQYTIFSLCLAEGGMLMEPLQRTIIAQVKLKIKRDLPGR